MPERATSRDATEGIRKLEKTFDPASFEQRWYALWEAEGRFQPSGPASTPRYVMVIPPPNVTGRLHIGHALGRSDPTSAELLEAVRSFVADVPAPYLARSDALVRDILEPTLYRLRRLDPRGRAAYWRLFETGRRRDPALHRKGTNRRSRFALRVATWHPARVAHRAARFLMRRALGSA